MQVLASRSRSAPVSRSRGFASGSARDVTANAGLSSKLFRWPEDPRESVRKGVRIFDRVAPRYDVMRQLISGGREDEWKRRTLLAALQTPPRRCLDIATGTGDVAALLLRTFPETVVVGVDGNRAMLDRARSKLVPRARLVA